MNELLNHVKTLAARAASTPMPDDALHYSQAALNLAHAISTLNYRGLLDETTKDMGDQPMTDVTGHLRSLPDGYYWIVERNTKYVMQRLAGHWLHFGSDGTSTDDEMSRHAVAVYAVAEPLTLNRTTGVDQ